MLCFSLACNASLWQTSNAWPMVRTMYIAWSWKEKRVWDTLLAIGYRFREMVDRLPWMPESYFSFLPHSLNSNLPGCCPPYTRLDLLPPVQTQVHIRSLISNITSLDHCLCSKQVLNPFHVLSDRYYMKYGNWTLSSNLFLGLEHAATESASGRVLSDVTEDLQVCGVMGDVEHSKERKHYPLLSCSWGTGAWAESQGYQESLQHDCVVFSIYHQLSALTNVHHYIYIIIINIVFQKKTIRFLQAIIRYIVVQRDM